MHVAVTKAGNIALLFSESDDYDCDCGGYIFCRHNAKALVMTLLDAIEEADRIKSEAED